MRYFLFSDQDVCDVESNDSTVVLYEKVSFLEFNHFIIQLYL